MNDIEEKLWEYIDGSCSADAQEVIEQLIATNAEYRQKYNELMQLNADFAAIELDEPSMAFTYNVMEAIRQEAPLKPLKAAIDKRIIWGIGAFFVLTITALLIFVLTSINWTSGSGTGLNLPVKIEMPNLSGIFNSNLLKVFILFDIVLSLYIADNYLRKKLNSKTA